MVAFIILFPAVWICLENQFALLERAGVGYDDYSGISRAVTLLFAVFGAVPGYLALPANDTERVKIRVKDLVQLLNIKGRLRRKHFLVLQLAALIALYFFHFGQNTYYMASTFTILFYAAIVFEFFIAARRLQDCGISPLCSFGIIVPYLNVLFILFLCIKPGQPGENKYGPDPREQEPFKKRT